MQRKGCSGPPWCKPPRSPSIEETAVGTTLPESLHLVKCEMWQTLVGEDTLWAPGDIGSLPLGF